MNRVPGANVLLTISMMQSTPLKGRGGFVLIHVLCCRFNLFLDEEFSPLLGNRPSLLIGPLSDDIGSFLESFLVRSLRRF